MGKETKGALHKFARFGAALAVVLLGWGGETAAQQASVTLSLQTGVNLVSVPVDFSPARSSADLLVDLGASVLSISRLDTATNTFETTEFINGVAQSTGFPIVLDQAYSIEMVQAET